MKKKKKKQSRNLLRKKKSIAVDKFPQTKTIKILLVSFFQSKTCYVNHALFFLFVVVFSNVSRQLLTLQTLHTISCVNQLMPGGNSRWSYALKNPANFTLQHFLTTRY